MLRISVLALALAACGGSTAAPDAGIDAQPPDLSVESPGPYPVGTTRFVLDDTARGRMLPTQAWYPAAESARGGAATGFPIQNLEDDPNQTTYAGLLAAAPATCPNRTAHAAVDAAAATGTFPLLVMSHCHDCTRWSLMTIAERLASQGFVVVAVDHVQNTLWDNLAGTAVPLSKDFLPVREGDVRFALDQVLAGATPLTVAVDPDKVGVFGHSFGSVTAGLVAQDDPRIKSAFGLSAPMDNALLPGVDITRLKMPLGFLVAEEDNSITAIGNQLIDGNYMDAPDRAWEITVPDAGHWSWSDIVGVTSDFAPGCGDGKRQTNGMPFTYLDAATGRALAASYVTAFFRATLEGDAGAASYLTSGRGGVTAVTHP